MPISLQEVSKLSAGSVDSIINNLAEVDCDYVDDDIDYSKIL